MNWSVLAALAFAFALDVPAASPPKSAECLTCHDDKGAAFQSSVHGSFSCTDCHTAIKGYPHPENQAKVKCDTCHNDPVSGVKASVHATASAQPCQGCHGDAHGILPASDPKSSTYASNLPRTCGGCHGDAKFAKQHKISMVDVFSRALNRFATDSAAPTIHDHFDGADHCIECHGPCRLRRDDLALTRMVRYLLESWAATGWKEIPDNFVWPLQVLLGAVRCTAMWKRARRR